MTCHTQHDLGEDMNKSELIKNLAEEKGLHVDESAEIVDAFVDAIKEALVRGDRVEIRGFGSFKMKEYKGYTGRNPKTGAVVDVTPKKLPFFRPGKELKEYLNG
ncbi:HU family DNA-binding protein [Maridesulfovibrio sp.]|uniref:HU family DNA-binding protein n=2 Tax=Maridesulfovibrio sp. TaxID=2795000 RepID=UPI0029CA4553|nr:HU family DNA-binding protein [Maridesulfovibrio sp.]